MGEAEAVGAGGRISDKRKRKRKMRQWHSHSCRLFSIFCSVEKVFRCGNLTGHVINSIDHIGVLGVGGIMSHRIKHLIDIILFIIEVAPFEFNVVRHGS